MSKGELAQLVSNRLTSLKIESSDAPWHNANTTWSNSGVEEVYTAFRKNALLEKHIKTMGAAG